MSSNSSSGDAALSPTDSEALTLVLGVVYRTIARHLLQALVEQIATRVAQAP